MVGVALTFLSKKKGWKEREKKGSNPNIFSVLDHLQKFLIKHQQGAADFTGEGGS